MSPFDPAQDDPEVLEGSGVSDQPDADVRTLELMAPDLKVGPTIHG